MILKTLPLLMLAVPQMASAITIELDYRFDGGFFDAPERRTAMRAICDYFESILGDSLAEINPADFPSASWDAMIRRPDTGNIQSLGNIVIPQDTFILFAGGRQLGSAGSGGGTSFSASASSNILDAWTTRIRTRGQAGAGAQPRTDFAPWGGQVTFDSSRAWNFSLSEPDSGTDFVPIALHEVCHALGIGIADSWDAQAVNNAFTGAESRAAFGQNVPLQIGAGHWRDDQACQFSLGHRPGNPLNILSPTIGQFGTPAGNDQQVLLDPSSCSAGPFLRVLTELDVAGLADTGWEIISGADQAPPLTFTLTQNGAAVDFPTFVGRSYQLERSTGLTGFSDFGSSILGDGQRRTLTDSSPLAAQRFYRVRNQPAPSGLPLPSLPKASGVLSTYESPPPKICTGCANDH